jgi:hypothetical protein
VRQEGLGDGEVAEATVGGRVRSSGDHQGRSSRCARVRCGRHPLPCGYMDLHGRAAAYASYSFLNHRRADLGSRGGRELSSAPPPRPPFALLLWGLPRSIRVVGHRRRCELPSFLLERQLVGPFLPSFSSSRRRARHDLRTPAGGNCPSHYATASATLLLCNTQSLSLLSVTPDFADADPQHCWRRS